MDMDVKLNTNEIGFKEILSLIPAIYAKDFAGLKTDGVATLNAYAKGKMVGEQLPEFNVDLNVKNAMFRYPSLPAGVDGINIVANVKNPGGTADATTIVVNPFNFTLAGNPFSIFLFPAIYFATPMEHEIFLSVGITTVVLYFSDNRFLNPSDVLS